MPNRIAITISKDGNATEYYEKNVVTEHISTMEPGKEKNPKLYFYKFVIDNLKCNMIIKVQTLLTTNLLVSMDDICCIMYT